ncbi:MAG: signal peptidase I [Methylococcales bacterium]|nr:signal peptidase I [Methylococcales bacterium]
MHFDFSFFLFTATVISGLVWGGYLGYLRYRPSATPTSEPVIVDYARSFFPVLLIVFILRSFLAEPFRIPSGSMMPTLLIGDFILVNKFIYGIRLPVINKKIIPVDEPERGDVVVFRYPKDPSVDYIKRVIGLPGDRIGYFQKKLYINGQPAKQELQETYQGLGQGSTMTGAQRRQENLDNKSHDILINPGMPTVQGEFQVPAGHYFMMGDNRDNSNDSRYWGMVPEANLVGKAFLIWMNWDLEHKGIDFKRIGQLID